ncbi:unnamed protein product [Prorocentrum cordatum]|uniref:FACT complex subunit n=1 Tax=Prorocentrum cordatum TaxID=2364126 RepID=A0ABN9VD32_9DINO|nr:unnamed protein product [Polarella glacialis]
MTKQTEAGESTIITRDKYFIDDLLAICWAPIKDLKTDQVLWAEISRDLNLSLHFLLTGSATWEDAEFQAWSKLRLQVRQDIIKAHSHLYKTNPVDDSALAGYTSEEIAHVAMQKLAEKDDSTKKEEAASKPIADPRTQEAASYALLLADRDLVMGLMLFLQNNDLTAPTRYHSGFQNMIREAFAKDSSTTPTVSSCVAELQKMISMRVPNSYIEFAVLAQIVSDQDGISIDEATMGIFKDIDIVTKLQHIRAEYMMEAVTGVKNRWHAMRDIPVAALEPHQKKIGDCDMAMDGEKAWPSFWEKILDSRIAQSENVVKAIEDISNGVLQQEILDAVAQMPDPPGKGGENEKDEVEGKDKKDEQMEQKDEVKDGEEAKATESKESATEPKESKATESKVSKSKEGEGTDIDPEMKLSELRTMFREIPAVPSAVEAFMKCLEGHLWHALAGSCSKEGDAVEQGLSFIVSKRHDDPIRLMAKKADPCITLPFIGRVTRLPSKGALPLCKVWGQDFFIDGSGFNRFDNEAFIPAWMVRVGAGKNVVTTMDVRVFDTVFNFRHTPVAKEVVERVPIKIHYLAMKEALFNRENVELSRPPIVGVVTAGQASEMNKAMGKVRGQRAMGKHKLTLADPVWKARRHAFK